MGFFVIKGTYHVKGYSPDGDSLRFKAADPTNWDKLGGPPHLSTNSRNHVQLRLEGIDTLETHYSAPGGTVHQPLALAHAATDFVLAQTGITGVVWNAARTRVEEATDGTPGYILSRQKDKNGRPVAFAFAGTTTDADGADVFVDAARLPCSINYRSLAAGHAFATFYTGLFADLRAAMAAATAEARAAGAGVFAADRTNAGSTVDSLAAITDRDVLMPKLFRRLAAFIGGDPTPDLSGLKAWLAAEPEQVLLLRTMNFTHFDNLVDVAGQVVKLTELPESLVFGE